MGARQRPPRCINYRPHRRKRQLLPRKLPLGGYENADEQYPRKPQDHSKRRDKNDG
nr:MAG TPA: hypothetical protein [Caudoviricetes sp.]